MGCDFFIVNVTSSVGLFMIEQRRVLEWTGMDENRDKGTDGRTDRHNLRGALFWENDLKRKKSRNDFPIDFLSVYFFIRTSPSERPCPYFCIRTSASTRLPPCFCVRASTFTRLRS